MLQNLMSLERFISNGRHKLQTHEILYEMEKKIAVREKEQEWQRERERNIFLHSCL